MRDLLPAVTTARDALGDGAVTTAIYTTARLGLANDLTDQVEHLLGRPPTTLAAFAARERAVSSRSTQRAGN